MFVAKSPGKLKRKLRGSYDGTAASGGSSSCSGGGGDSNSSTTSGSNSNSTSGTMTVPGLVRISKVRWDVPTCERILRATACSRLLHAIIRIVRDVPGTWCTSYNIILSLHLCFVHEYVSVPIVESKNRRSPKLRQHFSHQFLHSGRERKLKPLPEKRVSRTRQPGRWPQLWGRPWWKAGRRERPFLRVRPYEYCCICPQPELYVLQAIVAMLVGRARLSCCSKISDFFYLIFVWGLLPKIWRPLPKYCLLYTSPSPRDLSPSRMPSSA